MRDDQVDFASAGRWTNRGSSNAFRSEKRSLEEREARKPAGSASRNVPDAGMLEGNAVVMLLFSDSTALPPFEYVFLMP